MTKPKWKLLEAAKNGLIAALPLILVGTEIFAVAPARPLEFVSFIVSGLLGGTVLFMVIAATRNGFAQARV